MNNYSALPYEATLLSLFLETTYFYSVFCCIIISYTSKIEIK